MLDFRLHLDSVVYDNYGHIVMALCSTYSASFGGECGASDRVHSEWTTAVPGLDVQ